MESGARLDAETSKALIDFATGLHVHGAELKELMRELGRIEEGP